MVSRISDADDLAHLSSRNLDALRRGMSGKAFDIEMESFKIIDAEIGSHNYSEFEWPIVRRIIHATADFDFAKKEPLIFHKDAMNSAFKAIQDRRSIVTDVDMVLAAINKRSLADFGIQALCKISDAEVAKKAKHLGKTRSEVAMRSLAEEVQSGIVVIGNAPTALYELINMIKEGSVRPALVVGLPVGFVSAAESKAELAKTDVPFITNVGRKGGSPAASAAINAILLLCREKQASRTGSVNS